MRVLNKLIYSRTYIIRHLEEEIIFPESILDEYIIKKDANVQYIIHYETDTSNFDILNIRRVILIKQIRSSTGTLNIFFYSPIDFDIIKEYNSIFLKNLKEKMFRIYFPNEPDVSNPPEYLSIKIRNDNYPLPFEIYFELRELTAVLL
jgi:hypothetical protein